MENRNAEKLPQNNTFTEQSKAHPDPPLCALVGYAPQVFLFRIHAFLFLLRRTSHTRTQAFRRIRLTERLHNGLRQLLTSFWYRISVA